MKKLLFALCALALSFAPAQAGVDTIARGLAVQAKNGTPYASQQWYVPDGTTRLLTGGASAAGTLRCAPGYIHRLVTVTDLAVRIATSAASGNFQLAVYKADTGSNAPTGAPLYVSPSQSTAAAGLVDITGVNLPMPISLYWFCVQSDTNGASVVFIAPDVAGTYFEQSIGSSINTSLLNTVNYVALQKTGTFGTWPTLTGNLTNDGFSANTSSIGAAVAFKAQ